MKTNSCRILNAYNYLLFLSVEFVLIIKMKTNNLYALIRTIVIFLLFFFYHHMYIPSQIKNLMIMVFALSLAINRSVSTYINYSHTYIIEIIIDDSIVIFSSLLMVNITIVIYRVFLSLETINLR